MSADVRYKFANVMAWKKPEMVKLVTRYVTRAAFVLRGIFKALTRKRPQSSTGLCNA